MDHPPIGALLIKMGCALFDKELGVRFFYVLLSAASIWTIRKTIEPTNDRLYYSIIFSIAILQFEGFIAAPDGPLLFFGALYIYVLKGFFENQNIKYASILGVAIALLLYSKYHGILLILFTLIANPHLFKTKYFWITFGIALLLYTPHIYWQVVHQFPSLEFHLLHRGDNTFKVYHTINFLLSSLIFFGPFVGFLLYASVLKYKTNNRFERTLKTIIYGTFIFYLLLTARGNIESNWLLILTIPIVYIGYNYFEQNDFLKKWHYKLFIPGIVLIFIVRFFLAYDVLPKNELTKAFNNKFHSSKKFVDQLHERLGDIPVVFMNSYRRPSIYHYYSGVPAITRRDAWARKTQYNLWEVEEKWRGKNVMAVMDYYEPTWDSIMINDVTVSYARIVNLQPSSTISIVAHTVPKEAKPRSEIRVDFDLRFRKTEKNSSSANELVVMAFFETNSDLIVSNSPASLIGQQDFNKRNELGIKCPDKEGVYNMYLGIKTNWLSPTINSKAYSIRIVK